MRSGLSPHPTLEAQPDKRQPAKTTLAIISIPVRLALSLTLLSVTVMNTRVHPSVANCHPPSGERRRSITIQVRLMAMVIMMVILRQPASVVGSESAGGSTRSQLGWSGRLRQRLKTRSTRMTSSSVGTNNSILMIDLKVALRRTLMNMICPIRKVHLRILTSTAKSCNLIRVIGGMIATILTVSAPNNTSKPLVWRTICMGSFCLPKLEKLWLGASEAAPISTSNPCAK